MTKGSLVDFDKSGSNDYGGQKKLSSPVVLRRSCTSVVDHGRRQMWIGYYSKDSKLGHT